MSLKHCVCATPPASPGQATEPQGTSQSLLQPPGDTRHPLGSPCPQSPAHKASKHPMANSYLPRPLPLPPSQVPGGGPAGRVFGCARALPGALALHLSPGCLCPLRAQALLGALPTQGDRWGVWFPTDTPGTALSCRFHGALALPFQTTQFTKPKAVYKTIHQGTSWCDLPGAETPSSPGRLLPRPPLSQQSVPGIQPESDAWTALLIGPSKDAAHADRPGTFRFLPADQLPLVWDWALLGQEDSVLLSLARRGHDRGRQSPQGRCPRAQWSPEQGRGLGSRPAWHVPGWAGGGPGAGQSVLTTLLRAETLRRPRSGQHDAGA